MIQSRRPSNLSLCIEKKQQTTPPGVLLKYDLKEVLGRGSCGSVFRAVKRHEPGEVAVKVVDADKDERCRYEYELLQSVKHPGLATGLDFFQEGHSIAIVMSYHQGSRLTRAISRCGPFTENASRDFFRTLLLAVGYLHSASILHGDIKPDNIIIGGQPDLTLVDFSSARYFSSKVPCSCTQEYAAPEVLNGELISEKHDVWCSGLCLYFMLSGQLPWSPGIDAVEAPPLKIKHVSAYCCDALGASLAIDKHLRPEAATLLKCAWLSSAAHD